MPDFEDSVCEIRMNGVVMLSATLDGNEVHRALAAGVNPLPLVLRRIADEIDAQEVVNEAS